MWRSTKLSRANFDVVLMDIQMPIMDGYKAMNHLKAAGYDRPVIALTAHAMEEEKDKTNRMGFVAHVSKPIEIADLIGNIKAVLTDSSTELH